jgi:GNAT superfamily N-acetyltransferase
MEPERSGRAIEPWVVRELRPEHSSERARLVLFFDPPATTLKPISPAIWSAGAFVDYRLRGLVEGRRGSNSSIIEVSLVVEPAWRRWGIGGALLRAATGRAKATGAATLRIIFPRHDWSMRRLASKANARLDMVLNEMSADIALCAPFCPTSDH